MKNLTEEQTFLKPGEFNRIMEEAILLGEKVVIITADGKCFYREQDVLIHAEDISSEVQYYYVEDYKYQHPNEKDHQL